MQPAQERRSDETDTSAVGRACPACRGLGGLREWIFPSWQRHHHRECRHDTAGISDISSTAALREKAVKFAECMRSNGISAFPDPDASGQLTIDAVANTSSIDISGPGFEQALGACKGLEPPGFTGTKVTPSQRTARLEFARCIRRNGVPDFPDPTPNGPLVDTNRIPSAATPAGMSALNAAMQTCSRFAAAAGVSGGPVMRNMAAGRCGRPGCRCRYRRRGRRFGAKQATTAAREPANTATVERGKLSDQVSQSGTLTYRARADGSPYSGVQPGPRDLHEPSRWRRPGRLWRACCIG